MDIADIVVGNAHATTVANLLVAHESFCVVHECDCIITLVKEICLIFNSLV